MPLTRTFVVDVAETIACQPVPSYLRKKPARQSYSPGHLQSSWRDKMLKSYGSPSDLATTFSIAR